MTTLSSRALLAMVCFAAGPVPLVAQAADRSLCDRLATPATREQYRPQADAILATGGAAAEFVKGCLAWDEARSDASIGFFEEAVRRAPAASDYHLWLGNAYGVKAQRANVLSQAMLARKTKAAFDRAVQLDPDNLMAREGLMQYYLQAPGLVGGSVEKAFEQAQAIRQRNAYRGGFALVTIAARRKDVAAAERELTALHRTYPDSIDVVSSLATFHGQHANWRELWALLDATERGRLAGHPRVPYLIGRAAALSGEQLPRGAAALRAYLERPPARGEPRATNAQLRLGQIHEKQGQIDQARAAYRAALSLDAKNDEAKRALKALPGR